MSLLELEEFALSESLGDGTMGDDSLLEGEGVEHRLEELPSITAEIPDEEEVEELLSSMLMNGFMLIEQPCPKCMIPLVKKPTSGAELKAPSDSTKCSSSSLTSELSQPRIVTSTAIQDIPKPIKGIPYCVTCESYVLTNQVETRLLEELRARQILGRTGNASLGLQTEEISLGTRTLLSLGDQIVEKATPSTVQVLESPSAWMHSPTSVSSQNSPSSFLFKAAFSMHQKRRKCGTPQGIHNGGGSMSSYSCSERALRGKRLIGKAASQDEGVEMKLETESVSIAVEESVAPNTVATSNHSKRSITEKSNSEKSLAARSNSERSIAARKSSLEKSVTGRINSERSIVARQSNSGPGSVPEKRDDDISINALWQFVGSSHSTAREEDCEVSLAERTFERDPNFGILSNGSPSVESEHGGDCTETEEDYQERTLSQHFAGQEAKRTTNFDADREEDDFSVGSEMEILSHSIHYIETDNGLSSDKTNGKEEPRQAQWKKPITLTTQDGTNDDLAEEDDASKDEEEENEDVLMLANGEEVPPEPKDKDAQAAEKVARKVLTQRSNDILERTLALEKDRLRLDKASTVDTEERMTLEDMYCTDGELSPKRKMDNVQEELIVIDTDSDNPNAMLQQQLQDELKMQGLGESDSILKEQPGLSMLEGLSSDSASTAEIAAALDKIERATITILEEVKARNSMEESITAGTIATELESSANTPADKSLDRDLTNKFLEEAARQVGSLSVSGHSSILLKLKDTASTNPSDAPHTNASNSSTPTEEENVPNEVASNSSTTEAETLTNEASTIDGEVDDDIMQEYTVRREIATKVLGTKMLQGYRLRESQCDQCGMPQMEFQSIVHCVVCPVLARKAKKELWRMQKLKEKDGESAREIPMSIKRDEEAIIDEVLQEYKGSSSASVKAKESHQSQNKKHKEDTVSKKETLSPLSSKQSCESAKSIKSKCALQTLGIFAVKEKQIPSPRLGGKSSRKQDSFDAKAEELRKLEEERPRKPESSQAKAEELRQKLRLEKDLFAPQKQNPTTKKSKAAGTIEKSEKKSNSSQVSRGAKSSRILSKLSTTDIDQAVEQGSMVTKTPSKMEPMVTKKTSATKGLLAKAGSESAEQGSNGSNSSSRKRSGSRNYDGTASMQQSKFSSVKLSQRAPKVKLVGRGRKPPKPSPVKSSHDLNRNALTASPKHHKKLPTPTTNSKKKKCVTSDQQPRDKESQNPVQECLDSLQSHTTHDSEICVASQAPANIKSADDRRKQLEAKEKTLMEEGRVAKEAAEKCSQHDCLAERVRRKVQVDRDEELLKDQLKLIVETKRLETMERMRLANEIEFKSPQESLLAVFALQEERKRLRKEALLQKEIRILEEARRQAEMEVRRVADEKRAAQEAERIDSLEQEAQRKAKEAEEAVAKANAALEEVNTAKNDILLAQVIAKGDADTVAETEANLRAEAEDYFEEKVLPSASFLWRERWETLRLEGRSVMTRRLIGGWTMLPKYCLGVECQSSPLLMKGGKSECVVCGGSGTGEDGAYGAPLPESSSDESPPETVETPMSSSTPSTSIADLEKASTCATSKAVVSESSVSDRAPKVNALETVQQIHEDFEEKRRTVSKEIGKRMLEGWTLLDMSCPNCVMPLLTDEDGENEICVLCGVVGKLKGNTNEAEQFTVREDAELQVDCSGVSDKATVAELSRKVAAITQERHQQDGYAKGTPFMQGRRQDVYCAEGKATLAAISKQTQLFIKKRHKDIEDKCDAPSVQEGIYAMQNDCAKHGQHFNELAQNTNAYLKEHEAVVNIGKRLEKTSTYLKEHETMRSIGKHFEMTGTYLKENETVLRIGKHFENTGAFIQPGVNGVVAMMSEAPCSPKTAVHVEDARAQETQQKEKDKAELKPHSNKCAVGQSFSFVSMDSSLIDLGVTSSLSVPTLDEAQGILQKSLKVGDHSGFSHEEREKMKSKPHGEVELTLSDKTQVNVAKISATEPSKHLYQKTAKTSVVEGDELLPSFSNTQVNVAKISAIEPFQKLSQKTGKKTTENRDPKKTEGTYEEPANKLSKARKSVPKVEKELYVPGSCASEDDTFATIDSMQPVADQSVIVDATPSSQSKPKGVKKRAAAAALERLKGKKEKAAESKQKEKNTDDVKKADNGKALPDRVIARSFSANARPRGVLKQLTIDTSSPRNGLQVTPETPMTPRSPTRKQRTPTLDTDEFRSPHRPGKSSPVSSPRMASPRFGRFVRESSPRAPASPNHRELHDRLHHLLGNTRSPTNAPRSRASRSEPNSPVKRSRFDAPDYLIHSIAGRQHRQSNLEGQHQPHEDPPAMVSNHIVGRRVARDPEDRSIVTEEEERSIASRSYMGTPRVKPKPGLSPRSLGSPSPRLAASSTRMVSPFPESPSKVRKMKEDAEGVTLVIPKDFDVTNDSQLRNLILAAKKGVESSPASNRLALQGRIKQMGDTEIIDVIDLELPDDEEFSGGRAGSGRRIGSHSHEVSGASSSHTGRQLQVETRQPDSPSSKQASSPSLRGNPHFRHAPSPGENANQLPSLQQSPHRANDVVVSRMHPPSPGESPFNGRPAVRKRRPKITPESMMNRNRPNRNRPRPSPTGPRNHNTGSNSGSSNRNRTFNSSPGQQTSAPTNVVSRSSGSGSSINPEKVSPDQFFNSTSTSTPSHMSNIDEHQVLANMSFSSSGGSSQVSYFAGSNSMSRVRSPASVTTASTARDSTAAGLPPVSPRKGTKRRTPENVSEREITSGNDSVDSLSHYYDAGATLSRESSVGFETGVTSGRSSSFDRSTTSSSKAYVTSSSDEENKIRVLNSESQGEIEIARRRSRSSSYHRAQSPEVTSVQSTTFDGIISRIDTCKSKLKPALAKEGARGQKMVALIEKLTRDAADVSTVGDWTRMSSRGNHDDDSIPST